jgi:hypothetical protein
VIALADVLSSQRLPMKTWDAWVSARLVEAPVRFDDVLALDGAQAVRLMLLAAVRKAIRGRCTPETLAFALARAGDRGVPVELVKAGLIARLTSLFRLARRSLQTMTGIAPRFGTAKSADILAAADRLAERVAENVPYERREAVADAARTGAFAALSAIYLGADVRAQSRRFRDVLRMLGAQTEPSARLPARAFVRGISRFADTLADARDLLTLDQRTSPIFRRIESVPADGFWALFDLWPELSVAIERTWMRVADVFALPQLSEGERETFDTLLLTSLILFCADESSADRLENYRTLVQSAGESFERAVDKVVGVAEIAVAVRRLLPQREIVPA